MSKILLPPSETNKFKKSSLISFHNIPGVDLNQFFYFKNNSFTINNHCYLETANKDISQILKNTKLITKSNNILPNGNQYYPIGNCNIDTKGNIYYLIYENAITQYLLSLSLDGRFKYIKKLTDLANTTTTYPLLSMSFTKDNKLIISGPKNYRTGTSGDCSVALICFDENGNIIWNKAFTDDPESGWLSSFYAGNTIYYNENNAYFIMDIRCWVTSLNSVQSGCLIFDLSGNLIKSAYYNNLNSSICTTTILPVSQYSTSFYQIFTNGYVTKCNTESTSVTGFKINNISSSSSDVACIDSNYDLYFLGQVESVVYKIDKNFKIIWAKKFPQSINYINIINDYLYICGSRFILKCNLNCEILSIITINATYNKKINNNRILFISNPPIKIINTSLDELFNNDFTISTYQFTNNVDFSEYNPTDITLTMSTFTSTLVNKSIKTHTAFTINNISILRNDYSVTYGHIN